VNREETQIDSFPDNVYYALKMRITSIFGKKPIQSILSVCRSICVLLTNTSKPHSINWFSLSIIRMLLFPENSFTASAFFSKLHIRLLGFPFAKSFEESFFSGRPCWSYQKRQPLLRYFCSKYCCYHYFNVL